MSNVDYKKMFLETLELYIAEYRKAKGDEKALTTLRSHSNLKDIRVYINSSDLRDDFTLENDVYSFISYNDIELQLLNGGDFDLKVGNIKDFNFQFNIEAFLFGVKSRLLSDTSLPEKETLLVKGDRIEIPVSTQIQTKDPVLEVKANILDNLLGSQKIIIVKKKENK